MQYGYIVKDGKVVGKFTQTGDKAPNVDGVITYCSREQFLTTTIEVETNPLSVVEKLKALDFSSIRAIRAYLADPVANAGELVYLSEKEAQAVALRTQLRNK